ncbi:hypothetical protein GALL_433750 [mine drainage metagenome]|uniref:Uncharacterized protein n=1 Tax=mine drainage metagenome TaxID=410659 RepID=A0A1J5PTM0_9ZZZZ
MQNPQQHNLVFLEFDQGDPVQGGSRKIEGLCAARGGGAAGEPFALVDRQVAVVEALDPCRQLRSNDLPGFVSDQSEAGAQSLMPLDQQGQRAFQQGRVQPPAQTQGHADVIGGRGWVELLDHPQAALGQGRGQGPAARDAGDVNRFGWRRRKRWRGVDVPGEVGNRHVSEQIGQRQVESDADTDAGPHLREG